MELEELCTKISLPPEAAHGVLIYAKEDVPAELLGALTKEETAKTAYQKLKVLCPPERDGLDMLAYMLLAALKTYELYICLLSTSRCV